MGTLNPYSGPWEKKQVHHLLRRTLFGFNKQNSEDIKALGVSTAVDYLLRDIGPIDLPLNYNDDTDLYIPIGETWVNAGQNPNSGNKRKGSLRAWTIRRCAQNEVHIREKLTLFWHNHFVVADVSNANASFMNMELKRNQGLVNFKQLTKDMTIDSAMLRYLNGKENVDGSPNENYARELLELFTIGNGPLAGPGDYTYYTEEDIASIAKVLTGWSDRGYNINEYNGIESYFRSNRHTAGPKQLSHRFNNVIIEENGEEEYKDLIDVIFQQDEVSRFMSRNIYRWFVHSTIDDDVESNIIEPMAAIMRDNNYEIKPVISALLRSEHFYDEGVIGCMIKSPMDFVMNPIHTFGVEFPTELFTEYRLYASIYNFIAINQQDYYSIPSVAGWKSYYQSPGYGHIWLSSATLPQRQNYTDLLVVNGNVGNIKFGIDILAYVANINQPEDINNIVNDLEEALYAKPLSEEQKTTLKQIVLFGLPEFEWTIEYGQYQAEPDNAEKRTAIENKLKLLLLNMLRLPEYQLG